MKNPRDSLMWQNMFIPLALVFDIFLPKSWQIKELLLTAICVNVFFLACHFPLLVIKKSMHFNKKENGLRSGRVRLC